MRKPDPPAFQGTVRPADELTMWTLRELLAATALASLSACSSGSDTGTNPGVDPNAGVPQAILDLEVYTHDLINAERAANALPDLIMEQALRSVARAHSQDMADRDFFSHTNPDGLDPFDRMANAGISFVSAGENLAYMFGYADPGQTAVTGWMNSPGHRANILNGGFTHAGLGIAERANGEFYLTQVFASFSGTLIVRSFRIDTTDSAWSAN